MGSLGVLERLLMDILWSSERPLTANELRDLTYEVHLTSAVLACLGP